MTDEPKPRYDSASGEVTYVVGGIHYNSRAEANHYKPEGATTQPTPALISDVDEAENEAVRRFGQPIADGGGLQELDALDFNKVTYFVHKRDGSMEQSKDPYRRDYVSMQDFNVVREAYASSLKRIGELEKANG